MAIFFKPYLYCELTWYKQWLTYVNQIHGYIYFCIHNYFILIQTLPENMTTLSTLLLYKMLAQTTPFL